MSLVRRAVCAGTAGMAALALLLPLALPAAAGPVVTPAKPPPVYDSPVGFIDVPYDHMFFKEIDFMGHEGVSTGYPDFSFRPSAIVNRDSAAAFFYRYFTAPGDYTAPAKSRFTDVPVGHQFFTEIHWLAENDITTGYPDGTYRPHEPVDRDAIAAFFVRAVGVGTETYRPPTQSPFADVPLNHMFYREIAWLYQSGMGTGWMLGDGTRVFRPTTDLPREASAAFFYRCYLAWGQLR